MKDELRKELLAKRDAISNAQRVIEEEKINTLLWQIIKERAVKTLHTYLPYRSEVNILPLIDKSLKHKIKVISPKTLKNRKLEHLILSNISNIETGLYDTPFPVGNNQYYGSFDFVIVPGAGFDKKGYRLGYGGGYYDAFLSQHPNAYKVGVGFSFQLVNEVPVEAHDVKLDEIITG